jgi:hypothetical protein
VVSQNHWKVRCWSVSRNALARRASTATGCGATGAAAGRLQPNADPDAARAKTTAARKRAAVCHLRERQCNARTFI